MNQFKSIIVGALIALGTSAVFAQEAPLRIFATYRTITGDNYVALARSSNRNDYDARVLIGQPNHWVRINPEAISTDMNSTLMIQLEDGLLNIPGAGNADGETDATLRLKNGKSIAFKLQGFLPTADVVNTLGLDKITDSVQQVNDGKIFDTVGSNDSGAKNASEKLGELNKNESGEKLAERLKKMTPEKRQKLIQLMEQKTQKYQKALEAIKK